MLDSLLKWLPHAKLLGVVLACAGLGSLIFQTLFGLGAFFTTVLSVVGMVVAIKLLKSFVGLDVEVVLYDKLK